MLIIFSTNSRCGTKCFSPENSFFEWSRDMDSLYNSKPEYKINFTGMHTGKAGWEEAPIKSSNAFETSGGGIYSSIAFHDFILPLTNFSRSMHESLITLERDEKGTNPFDIILESGINALNRLKNSVGQIKESVIAQNNAIETPRNQS